MHRIKIELYTQNVRESFINHHRKLLLKTCKAHTSAAEKKDPSHTKL